MSERKPPDGKNVEVNVWRRIPEGCLLVAGWEEEL